MYIFFIYIFFLNYNPSSDLSFQNIKVWNNSDNFIKNVYDNYWTISNNSKFFVKATNDDLGEVYYYKENTPDNFANTFEVKLHNKEVMLNIRKEIKNECNFLRTYNYKGVTHSFYNCENKEFFGLIGLGIIKGENGYERYSIINLDSFIN